METEKILFAYATLLKEGMPANGRYLPDSVLYNVDPNKSHPIAVTAGIMTTDGPSYWNEVDVTFDGKSVIDSAYDGSSSFYIWSSGKAIVGSTVTTASFNLMGVKLESIGLYTVTVSLFGSDSNGDKGNMIDSIKCYFVVSSEG